MPRIIQGGASVDKPAQVVTVGASGCMYTNLETAIASITDAADDKRYTIMLYPGKYEQPNALQLPQYISLIGLDAATCIVSNSDTVPESYYVLAANGDQKISALTLEFDGSAGNGSALFVGGNNVSITDVHAGFEGKWGVVGGGNNLRVADCTLNFSNPFALTGNHIVMENCHGVFNGASSGCQALGDITGNDLHLTRNSFVIHAPAIADPTVMAYGIRCRSGSAYIAHNSVEILSDRGNAYGLLIEANDVTAGDGGEVYVEHNSIVMRTTNATPAAICGITVDGPTASNGGAVKVHLAGNTIDLTYDHAPVSTSALTMTRNGKDYTVETDHQSLGIRGYAIGAPPSGVTLTYLD